MYICIYFKWRLVVQHMKQTCLVGIQGRLETIKRVLTTYIHMYELTHVHMYMYGQYKKNNFKVHTCVPISLYLT